ncbi:M50 family metallopeptidase [Chakrabartyella piscis]|uniref:M50 family metallopeptidase n=1 Tax=Chakrabartyella piscis TaxID=2918914 RepID=UPI002958A07C|nr:site-2 protease family protein [Chakrabartyella piscis]
MSILITILVLGVLVLVHEWGHFIVAKKNGIMVEEFAIGMGKKLFSIQGKETEYTIRMIPMGGFCRMEGADGEGQIGERSFLNKSIGARFAVMAAGATMNFLLALVLLFGLGITSYQVIPVISSIVEDSAAAASGLQVGDEIIGIDGQNIHIYDELQYILSENTGESLDLKVLRGGGIYEYRITPRLDTERNAYLIGFVPTVVGGLLTEDVEGVAKASVFDTMQYSYYSMLNYIKLTAEGLVRVFTFTASQEEYGGPITIVQVVGDSYDAGMTIGLSAAVQNIVYIAAVLSANLGVLNLFPIPGLDGGKILLLGIEAVRGKPMSEEMENKIQFLGFVFLVGFMIFIFMSDIVKLFV